ncbi:hypothetical protein [Bosea sp. NBC_00550]|uniref:hypothetical protein n=1 Tax=Bosea sp. NBC_00550 TaxID=2969621 RepID=UPI00223167B5|nr:hypothetical protein [Bosea sp. NBC_00550]UZF95612.1 hypothetical protein NWE53_29580 [Bosea sp. NBC_00550]
MNTANLQLEGLMLSVAALFEELKRKGVLAASEIEAALARAENGASERTTELSEANAEAIRFPIRFLKEALRESNDALDYRSVAAKVGRARDVRQTR